MAIGIDDLDFYEEEVQDTPPRDGTEPPQEPPTQQEPPTPGKETPPAQNGEETPPPPSNQEGEDDIIKILLKEKGIQDPSKIKFDGDNNEVEERAWDTLSREEQLNILREPITPPSQETSEESDLTDDEIEFLNMLRTNNLTPQQYLSQLQQQMSTEPSYTVDELSDDDLFVLDLQARVDGITEEQLAKSLENAKQEKYTFEGLEIDMLGRNVYVDGEKKELTPKEYELLQYFILNKNIALSREKILNEVWGYDFFGEDRTVDTHVKMLRNNLGQYRDKIVTVRGMGYKFEE